MKQSYIISLNKLIKEFGNKNNISRFETTHGHKSPMDTEILLYAWN